MLNSGSSSRAERIRRAIERSAATQAKIAEYCNVAIQSVSGWKTTGRISDQNLRRLATISGFRYLWLLEGTGSERYSDQDGHQQEVDAHDLLERFHHLRTSKATGQLLNSLNYALANERLTEESIYLLARLIDSVASN